MQTVMETFVHATYVLATLVHISNISAVTDQILTKLLDPIFGGPDFCRQYLFGPKYFFDQNFFPPWFFWTRFFLDLKSFFPKISWTQNFWTKNFFNLNFFILNFLNLFFLTYDFFGLKIIRVNKILGPKNF